MYVYVDADAPGRVPGSSLHRPLRVRPSPGPQALHRGGAPGGKSTWTRWT